MSALSRRWRAASSQNILCTSVFATGSWTALATAGGRPHRGASRILRGRSSNEIIVTLCALAVVPVVLGHREQLA